jgi:MATE family multidrug resistance protein
MNFILKLLTSQNNLINDAQPFIIWVVLIPLASFSSFIWDGVFIGATASAAMRNTLFGATFLVFIPVYYFLNPLWENHALWLAMVLFMFARGAIQTFLFRRSVFLRIQ